MKKYVLIGGPCSGKSTTISILKKRGFSVVEEIAKQVLEERAGRKITQQELIKRQELIFQKQISEEKKYNTQRTGLLFLDRCAEDVPVYSNHLLGFTPDSIDESLIPTYDQIFCHERLPFKKEGFRIENTDEEAQILHDKIIQHYETKYNLIHVPLMKPGERVDFILRRIYENSN